MKTIRVVRPSLRLFFTSVATLALVCSTTARAQEATMATIKGEGNYTVSGSTQCDDKATSTIKAGERFIAIKNEKDWTVYLGSGVCGGIPLNRIRVLPDEPLAKLNFAGCKEKWRKRPSKRNKNEPNDTADQAESHGVANYYKTLVQISDGDTKAFAQFSSLFPFMDGAAAEGYFWDQWALLHVAGDDTFAKLLSRQSSKVRKEYATSIPAYTLPISNPKPYIKRHFPKTYSILYGK